MTQRTPKPLNKGIIPLNLVRVPIILEGIFLNEVVCLESLGGSSAAKDFGRQSQSAKLNFFWDLGTLRPVPKPCSAGD